MKQNEITQKLLIQHYYNYKKLQIQDIFKYLYQSTFGCEHMISSLEDVIDRISKEYNTYFDNAYYTIEPLDGEYSRVPLSYINRGLSIHTLSNLFYLSSKKEANKKEDLIRKLKVAQELINKNLLPFSKIEFIKSVEEWELKGYPALHHSDIFREEYKPSYRVISNDYIRFIPLFIEIDKRLTKGNVKIVIKDIYIDKKTKLSQLLTDIYHATAFFIDDLSIKPEFEDDFDFSVILDISPELQRKKLSHNNTKVITQDFFFQLESNVEKYYCKIKTQDNCDLKILILQ